MKFNVIPRTLGNNRRLSDFLEVGPRVPNGFRLIEAYARGNTIIVPIMDIPENEAHLHDCDWEGCGTLDHVIRFSVDAKYASQQSNPADGKTYTPRQLAKRIKKTGERIVLDSRR